MAQPNGRFCQSGLGFTKGRDDWSFVELYGILSTLGNAVCTDVLDDVEGFRDQLSSTQVTYSSEEDDSTEQFEYDLTMGQNLDICRSTSEGIVAHSLNVTREGAIDPAHTPLILTFYIDGGMRLRSNSHLSHGVAPANRPQKSSQQPRQSRY